jgi:DNA-directed RNA polymerase specialized sigma24 family protein
MPDESESAQVQGDEWERTPRFEAEAGDAAAAERKADNRESVDGNEPLHTTQASTDVRTDEELVLAYARTGKEAPFNELHVRYHRRVQRFFARKRFVADECEDLAQQTWESIIPYMLGQRFDDRGKGAFAALFWKIAMSKAVTAWQKRPGLADLVPLEPDSADGDGDGPRGREIPTREGRPDICLYLAELIDLIKREAKLSEDELCACQLDLIGLENNEIALEMGKNFETVKSMLARAHSKVARLLRKHGLEPDREW